MEPKTIRLTLPLGVFSALRKTPEAFSIDIPLTVAVK